jgi:fructokinase
MAAYDAARDAAWVAAARSAARDATINIITILSPQRIIMGGGVMKQEHLFPKIRAKVQTLLNGYVQHPAITEGIDGYIVPPGLGRRAGVLGAIALGAAAVNEAAVDEAAVDDAAGKAGGA